MDNMLRTGLLIAALTALFMAVGYWVSGTQGMVVALLIAAAMNLELRSVFGLERR